MTKISGTQRRITTSTTAATPSAPTQKADTPAAAPRADRYESGGQAQAPRGNHPPITADEDLTGELSARRASQNAAIGHGAGVLAAPRAHVRAGERYARRTADMPVDWSTPEATLNELAQVDGNRDTHNDATRCGAAAITAGVVLRGRDAANAARGRLLSRVGELEANLDGATGANVTSQRAALSDARQLLNDLPNAYRWTSGDGQEFQEAMYLTARVDEEQTMFPNAGRGRTEAMQLDTGLGTPTVHRYRDKMWGVRNGAVNQPVYNDAQGTAQNVDVIFSGGHFVLGTGNVGQVDRGRSSVMFDPLPQLPGRLAPVNPDRDDRGSAYTDLLDNLSGAPVPLARGAQDADQVPRLDRLSAAETAELRASSEASGAD